MSRVLIAGDLHFPFHRKGYLEFLKKVYKEYNCDYVVQIGDFLDQYCFTRYVRNPDALGAKQEFEVAREEAQKFFKAFPEGYITLGNHDARLAKRMAEVGIPEWVLKAYAEMIGMPDEWGLGGEVYIDDVRYFHGEGLSGNTELAVRKVGHSVVYGHTHKGSLSFKAMKKDLLFAMNVGCLIDQNTYAFEYAKHALEKSFIGCGVVIDGKQPILIPMNLDVQGSGLEVGESKKGFKLLSKGGPIKESKKRGRGRPRKV